MRAPAAIGCPCTDLPTEALVDATGNQTRLAELALLSTATPKPVTPLANELRRVVRLIAVIALGVGVGVDYGIYLYDRIEIHLEEGQDLAHSFLLALRDLLPRLDARDPRHARLVLAIRRASGPVSSGR